MLSPIVFYFRLFGGFFQQDEWFSFSWYVQHQDSLRYIWTASITHYNPLTVLANHLFFSFWNMDYQAFLLVSLLLHFIVLILIYILAKEIFKKDWQAAITAFLFGIFAAHYQGTAWVVVDISTHLATIFGILSATLFLRRRLHFSLVLLIISLLFKEITIGLFPLYLFAQILIFKKEKQTRKYSQIIVAVGAVYILVRILMLFGPYTSDQIVTQSLDVPRLVYNLITVPMKAVSQSILPPEFLLVVANMLGRFFPEKVTGGFGSPAFDMFVVKRVLEVTSLLSALIIAFWVTITKKRSKAVVFSLGWVLLNSLIFAFAPGRTGVIFTIDSRNLYFVSVGSAIMLAAVLGEIKRNSRNRAILLFLIILIPNLYFLNKNLEIFAERGRVRKSILNSIVQTIPNLPNKVVIYTQSDQSYYGLPPEEKILPFQSGLGQTLLAWYYPTEKFPKEFFEDRFLWEIESQGYQEVGNRGFGYFRDKDLLREAIRQYNLPEESVVSFSWNGKRNLLTNITDEVRQEIYVQKN